MSHKKLPDNAPIVNVGWIADRLGITPGRVRRYIAADGPLPRLVPNVEGLSEYVFMRQQAEDWVAAYKAAPKRGMRGDGSKQRPAKTLHGVKVTSRMSKIVAWLRANNGYIQVEEDSESNATEIIIEAPGTALADQYVNGEVFGSCTERTVRRLVKAGLIAEDDTYIEGGGRGSYRGSTTWYRAIKEANSVATD